MNREDIVADLRDDWEHYQKYMKCASRPDVLIERLSRAERRNEKLVEALQWIEKRCPRERLIEELDRPHRVHVEMAHDAGVCSRATLKETDDDDAYRGY